MDKDFAWVQCEDSKCLKWRQIPKCLLGTVSSISWYCRMNPDKAKAFCDYQQEEMKSGKGEQFVYSILEEGTLVWAKLPGFPSWPAIISSDLIPENFASYDHDGDLKHYHVEYFGEPRSHSWVLARNVEVYGSGSAPAPAVLAGSKGMASARARKSFEKAVIQADGITSLKPKERLKYCTFKAVADQSQQQRYTEGKTGEETPIKDTPDKIDQAQLPGRQRSLKRRSLDSQFDCCFCSKVADQAVGKVKKRRGRRKKNELTESMSSANDAKLTSSDNVSSNTDIATSSNLSCVSRKEYLTTRSTATSKSYPSSCFSNTDVIPKKLPCSDTKVNSNNAANIINAFANCISISANASAHNQLAPGSIVYVPNSSLILNSSSTKKETPLLNMNQQIIPVAIPYNKKSNANLHGIFTALYKQDCSNREQRNNASRMSASLSTLSSDSMKTRDGGGASNERSVVARSQISAKKPTFDTMSAKEPTRSTISVNTTSRCTMSTKELPNEKMPHIERNSDTITANVSTRSRIVAKESLRSTIVGKEPNPGTISAKRPNRSTTAANGPTHGTISAKESTGSKIVTQDTLRRTVSAIAKESNCSRISAKKPTLPASKNISKNTLNSHIKQPLGIGSENNNIAKTGRMNNGFEENTKEPSKENPDLKDERRNSLHNSSYPGANQTLNSEKRSRTLEERKHTVEDEEEEDIIDCLMGYTQKLISKSDYEEFDVCLGELEELQNEIEDVEKSLSITEASSTDEVSIPMDLSQSKDIEVAEDILKELEEVEGSIAKLSQML